MREKKRGDMRLRLRLPEVRREEYWVPMTYSYVCGGRFFALHQQCRTEMSAQNYSVVHVRRFHGR